MLLDIFFIKVMLDCASQNITFLNNKIIFLPNLKGISKYFINSTWRKKWIFYRGKGRLGADRHIETHLYLPPAYAFIHVNAFSLFISPCIFLAFLTYQHYDISVIQIFRLTLSTARLSAAGSSSTRTSNTSINSNSSEKSNPFRDAILKLSKIFYRLAAPW